MCPQALERVSTRLTDAAMPPGTTSRLQPSRIFDAQSHPEREGAALGYVRAALGYVRAAGVKLDSGWIP